MISDTDCEIKLPRKGGKRKRGRSTTTTQKHTDQSLRKETDTKTKTTSSQLTIDKLTTDSSNNTAASSNPNLIIETGDKRDEAAKDSKKKSMETGPATLTEEEMMLMSSKRKKKKKRRRKSGKPVEVEGQAISGIESLDAFSPGNEDEENTTSNRQDDFILRKLFKKSGTPLILFEYNFVFPIGVQTALKHDSLVEGGDPDTIIIDTEASRIAQSAARALRESCRQCQIGGRGGAANWGQPTWTGQNGTIGAPKYIRGGERGGKREREEERERGKRERGEEREGEEREGGGERGGRRERGKRERGGKEGCYSLFYF